MKSPLLFGLALIIYYSCACSKTNEANSERNDLISNKTDKYSATAKSESSASGAIDHPGGDVRTADEVLADQNRSSSSDEVQVSKPMLEKFPNPFEGGRFSLGFQLGISKRDGKLIQAEMSRVYEAGKSAQLEMIQLAPPIQLRLNQQLHLPALSPDEINRIKHSFANGLSSDISLEVRQLLIALFDRQLEMDFGKPKDISLIKAKSIGISTRLSIPAPLRDFDVQVVELDGKMNILPPNIRKGDRFDFLVFVP